MSHSSSHSHFSSLLPLWRRERAADRAMVLATLIQTDGSTYRKAGAQLLIAQSGEYAGLLSGGCLEADLREHARTVLTTGDTRVVQYHLREEDALFGVGAGCIGALQILMQRVGPQSAWQPMATLEQHWLRDHHEPVALICHSSQPHWLGATLSSNGQGITTHGTSFSLPWEVTPPAGMHPAQTGFVQQQSEDLALFVLQAVLPPRVLICGAGPDALPVVQMAQLLGWKITIADHRPALLQDAQFGDTVQRLPTRLGDQSADAQAMLLQHLQRADAIVIMSHHLDADLHYLQLSLQEADGYIGLLGPAARRERLLDELRKRSVVMAPPSRLHAPIGLNIGASTPETIALAIIAEIQQYLSASGRRAT